MQIKSFHKYIFPLILSFQLKFDMRVESNTQGRIYYEANEASASGPHQNFNAVSKADLLLHKKS